MTTREELIERVRQVIDDEVLTRTGRSVGDLASGHVARALAEAGLLADPEQAAELERLRAGIAAALHGLESDLDADASLPKRVEELAEDFMTLRLREIAEAPEHRRRQRQIAAGLKLIDDQMALLGSVMSEDKVGLLRDIRAALTGEVTLDD